MTGDRVVTATRLQGQPQLLHAATGDAHSLRALHSPQPTYFHTTSAPANSGDTLTRHGHCPQWKQSRGSSLCLQDALSDTLRAPGHTPSGLLTHLKVCQGMPGHLPPMCTLVPAKASITPNRNCPLISTCKDSLLRSRTQNFQGTRPLLGRQ